MSAHARRARTTFVLVHGAWHGGWCWRDIAAILRARGDAVHTPTLTGLAERRDELNADVDLERHVDDVVAVFERGDLRGVHLVGWSYGGMVVCGALARIHERVAAATFLDAFLPNDGEALADFLAPAERAGLAALRERGIHVPAPDPGAVWQVEEPWLGFAREHLSPQPVGTLTQPVRTPAGWPAHIAYTYVRCRGEKSDPFDRCLERARNLALRFETVEIDLGHALVMTHPERVVELLDRAGARMAR